MIITTLMEILITSIISLIAGLIVSNFFCFQLVKSGIPIDIAAGASFAFGCAVTVGTYITCTRIISGCEST